MWVGASGARGTIGGGNLEYTALKIAHEMLLSGERQRKRRFALGDALGQCCGGSVTLVFTLKEVEEQDAKTHSIVLFGAGHVGKEVAHILGRLPCSLTWIDPRPDVFPAAVAPNTKVVIEEEPAWMVDEAPAGASYLVMTHSHALGLELVERILRRGDAAFVGLIGSETKAAKFRSRLLQKNLAADRLVCPIGLFKGGKHPAEVALSAVAQILASAPRPATSGRAEPALLRSSP
jgi:xanthine dehydrogenase accessory factor